MATETIKIIKSFGAFEGYRMIDGVWQNVCIGLDEKKVLQDLINMI